MSHSLTKHEAAQQQVQQSRQAAHDTSTEEHHKSANASAGLNLNLFGALSGALSSSKKKTTHRNADGSSEEVEERGDRAMANGVASGQGNAYAAGNAQEHSLKSKSRGVEQEAAQGKAVQGSKQTDHLGIEG